MSGTHGVFQHRSGYFYTILEEDFCEIFKAPGVNEVCRAYITSILEHLTNKQYEATGKETDLWVFMSLPEMARRMRHACSERTIHKELQGMIKDGFIEKRRAVGKATMEYKLNIKRIRKALEALPDTQSCNSATYHLANLQEPSSNSARSTLQNDKINLANLQPRISIDIPLEETENNNESLSSPLVDDAPASITDLQEWKKITDKHKAVNLKGHTNGHHPDSGTRGLQHHSDGLHDSDGNGSEERRRDAVATDRQRTVEEADATEGQLAQTSTVPPVLAVGQAANGAHVAPTFTPPPQGVQRGAGAKRVHKNVTQAKPAFTLDDQQQAFWDLWCNVWFNAEIKPVLTETAYNHISKLAPYITTQEQLDSLIDYTRKDVAESIGMKRKMVQLGNMVHCYAGWKQAQQPAHSQKLKSGLDAQYGIQALYERQERRKA